MHGSCINRHQLPYYDSLHTWCILAFPANSTYQRALSTTFGGMGVRMRGILAIVYIYVHVCTHEYSKEGTLHTEMEAFLPRRLHWLHSHRSICEGMPNDPYILVIKLAFAFMYAYMHASTHGM